MNKLPTIKCRNKNCLLNDNCKCGSPCRNREDFSCLSINIDKPLDSEGKELKKQLTTKSWRDTLGLSRFK